MFRLADHTAPVWWEPVLWNGAAWFFNATLTGLVDGAITGGRIFLDGKEFPVSLEDGRLQAVIQPHQWAGVADGGAAQFYLDTSTGPVLWLYGRLTIGGATHDNA